MTNKPKENLPGPRGFTLVETLIAVTILITAVTGPLSIASRGLSTALTAKDQVTAYYLAQDAMEFIRFARDTNRLEGGDWITGAGSLDSSKIINLTNCTNANGCSVDSAAGTTPVSCSTASCTQGNIRYNTTTRLYSNSGGSALTGINFNRVVKITTPNPPNDGAKERTVNVTVSWSDTGGITRSVNIIENIFNWE
jgi:Tfp pilus assembly protein PilV